MDDCTVEARRVYILKEERARFNWGGIHSELRPARCIPKPFGSIPGIGETIGACLHRLSGVMPGHAWEVMGFWRG